MTPHAPCIHTGDYLAWYKHITGEWQYDFTAGEIRNTRTAKPVTFRPNADGYLITTVRIHGRNTTLLKHRAVWIAAHGILALPLDYTLEIDHINHDRTDCRIHNLRLVTVAENRRSSRKKQGPVPPDTVRAIRTRYAAGGISIRALAAEYLLSAAAVSRIIRNRTYHLTGYCCPLCGTAFAFGDWAEGPAPNHPPILICPSCGGPMLRTTVEEQTAITEYRRRKEEVLAIIAARTKENRRHTP